MFKRHAYQVHILFFFLLTLSLLLPTISHAQPQSKVENPGIQLKDPGSDLWRQVRQREHVLPGTSQVKGVESGVLINPRGDQWTNFRNQLLKPYGMYVLLGIIGLISVFALIRGKINIEGGLSGNMVFRFSAFERSMHWVMAIVFLFLALTGLILLLGRPLLIPIVGKDVFSILASMSKEGHNLMGPLFAVSVALMFYQFVKRNIYEKGDLTWLLKGGGFLGKGHVTGGFFNMGEKTWYWIFILVGAAVAVSGLILVSPNFGQGRVIMGLSHVVHSVGSILLIAVAIGHMYLGSIGTEGTLESMKTGYVDIKWAESHHDRWAKECHEKGLIVPSEDYLRIQGKKGVPIIGSTASVEAGLINDC